ncbi:MAG: YkgJ family cysteine cluster protein [Polyangiaceae bacterium]|nr:YkgJ family cysteine cluster protein [Polyangiaceae bacterium]
MADSECLRCGSCCHSREGTILVEEADIRHWRMNGRADLADRLVEGHFGQRAFPNGPRGACIHLGRPGVPNECSIYEDRATVCRTFLPGSGQCLEARRDGRLG